MNRLSELVQKSNDVWAEIVNSETLTPDCSDQMDRFAAYVADNMTSEEQRILAANLIGHLGTRDRAQYDTLMSALASGTLRMALVLLDTAENAEDNS